MARYLLDLATACRKSGLVVIEEPGWKTRGQGGMTSVKGLVCHWTATPDTTRPADDYPSLGIVRDGRAGLRGLLAQLGLTRSGKVRVLGGGLAYHAGEGYWPGIGSNGNANLIGIEAEEGGDGDWTPAMLAAYPRLAAALQAHYRFPLANVIGHYEWAGPRKSDIRLWPGAMPAFRRTVQTALSNPEGFLMALTDKQQADLFHRVNVHLPRWVAEVKAEVAEVRSYVRPGNDWRVKDGWLQGAVSNTNTQIPEARAEIAELSAKVDRLAEQVAALANRIK